MRKMALTPEADGFVATTRAAALVAVLDSPAPVYKSIEPVQAYDVELRWFLTPSQYNYFMAFWRTGTYRGVRHFLLDLPVDGGSIVECVCAFRSVPKLSAVEGLNAVVVASVEAIPADRTAYYGAGDAALVAELQAL